MELRKRRTIITGIIIITGIMAVVVPTGTIIALAGRGEVPAKNRNAELENCAAGNGGLNSVESSQVDSSRSPRLMPAQ